MKKEKQLKEMKPLTKGLSNEIGQIGTRLKRGAASCMRVNNYNEGAASDTSSLYSLQNAYGLPQIAAQPSGNSRRSSVPRQQ